VGRVTSQGSPSRRRTSGGKGRRIEKATGNYLYFRAIINSLGALKKWSKRKLGGGGGRRGRRTKRQKGHKYSIGERSIRNVSPFSHTTMPKNSERLKAQKKNKKTNRTRLRQRQDYIKPDQTRGHLYLHKNGQHNNNRASPRNTSKQKGRK